MACYILITAYSILLFMNPSNFVAVILKVLLVNLLAALNFANVFKNKNYYYYYYYYNHLTASFPGQPG